MPPYQFPNVPISLSTQNLFVVSDNLLWAIFLVVLVVFAVFTWILTYHWRNFDIKGSFLTLRAKLIYFMGSTVLIVMIALSILYG